MDQPVQTSPQEEHRYAELQLMALDYARTGDTPALDAMLAAGLPANLCDEKGNTLLMLAAYHGNAETVRTLLARGADPERLNARGQTPLAGVAFKGDEDVARVLLDGGAGAATPCEGGQTPIQFAAMFGNEGVYKLLASRGGAPAKNRVFGIPSGMVLGISSRIRKLLRRIPARRSHGKPL